MMIETVAHRLEVPVLETERLRLRPFREADLDGYAEVCADPEVMRYLGGRAFSRSESWRQIAYLIGHWHLRGFGMWALEEKDTGTFLGRVGFNDPEGWPSFEIGWSLGRRFWGRGYATEAARAALHYGFTAMDRDHVISIIHPDNRSSIRVAERLGETLEGTTRIPIVEGELLVYGIRRSPQVSSP
jgi:RimJ/RimL family protein N-acetyltransferase